jgi:hypothetical protein
LAAKAQELRKNPCFSLALAQNPCFVIQFDCGNTKINRIASLALSIHSKIWGMYADSLQGI